MGQHGRCAPDADGEVERGILADIGSGFHDPEGQPENLRLKQQEEQTKQQSYRERTVEGADFGFGPVAAVGLRSDASRSHTQEGKNPVNHVEHGATDGNGTDIDSGAEVANDGQIDQ